VLSEPSKTTTGSTLTPEQLAALERLLSSETLQRAPRVHKVLRFMVEAVLAGRPETVNEQVIGREIFQRPQGYSPAEDNIVRVTVSNLRARLDDYYQEQGRNESWLLDIPKGKYVPHLRLRDTPRPVLVTQAIQREPPAPTPIRNRVTKLPWILLAALLTVNLAAGLVYYGRREAPATRSGFLQQFLGDRHIPASLVLADANLLAYRIVFQKTVPLRAYLDRSYLQPGGLETPETRLWRFLSLHDETTVTSALLASRIQRALYPMAIGVHHPQDLSLKDVQNDTLVLLGGPWINPWGQLFESRLTFQIVAQDQNRGASEIRNVHPQRGEADRFVPHAEGGFQVSYARIAVIPNLAGSGHIILLGSNTPDALEAAGDFLVKPYGVADLLKSFHCSKVASLPPFEVMLEVRGVQNTPASVRVIAHRAIMPAGS
jgi:hypothetical protein